MVKAEVDALEDCLERLQAGAGIDQILSLYPQWAEDLRPLLKSAQMARSLRVTSPVPEKAMAQSRNLFIEKTLNSERQGIFGLKLHFSHSFLASISAVLILAIATSFVSAQSIPGDILYPVKIAGEQTRLLLTANSSQRLDLEESYDATRADEVEDVLQAHRLVEVTFVGLLTQPAHNQWQVAGVTVVFPPELNSISAEMENTYVEVTGLAKSDDFVQVSQIHLRELDFSGTVVHIGLDSWLVDQVVLRVGSATVIHGVPSVDAYVSIKAYRLEDGTLEAGQIDVVNPGKQAVQVQVTSTQEIRVATATLSAAKESGNGPTDQPNTPAPESDGIPQQANNTPTQESYPTTTSTGESQSTATQQEGASSSTNTPVVSTDTPTSTVTATSEQPTDTQPADTLTPTQGEHSETHHTPTPTPTPTPLHRGEGG